MGDYRVVVKGGDVVAAVNLGGRRYEDSALSDVATFADLRAMAESAPAGALVEYTVDDAGMPESLSLDPVPNGIDDEECYRVTRLRAHEPTATPLPSAGGFQDVRV